MLIKTIWTNNAGRNFNYLIVCPQSGEALAIDPLDHKQCLQVSKDNGFEITQVLNTHDHWDHTGGNAKIVAATGAKVLAHHGAASSIKEMDQGLHAGDAIKVGSSIELEVLDTPGHTMSHVCVIAHGSESAIFSGDTLFNAGAGNCHNGGHPEELYRTFKDQLHTLHNDTKIYPGHDYLVNNLKFTLDREPNNPMASELLVDAEKTDPRNPIVTTIALEQQINTFFRLDEPAIIEKLCEEDPSLPNNLDAQAVFLKLRELRNHW